MSRKLFQVLASAIQARLNCAKSDNAEWFVRHTDTAETLVKNLMPSGSGFDNGTTLNLDKSTGERLVFETSFHHMADGGMYDGWSEHTVTVTPSFDGFNLAISGRNRNDIKDYIAESFDSALTSDIEPANV